MTPYERAVLARLLEKPFAGSVALKHQLSNALVRDISGPGDHRGSIEFKVRGDAAAPVDRSVPVEGRGCDVDGVEVDLLLHVKDGFLDSLEVVKADGSDLKSPPAAKSLRVELLSYPPV